MSFRRLINQNLAHSSNRCKEQIELIDNFELIYFRPTIVSSFQDFPEVLETITTQLTNINDFLVFRAVSNAPPKRSPDRSSLHCQPIFDVRNGE